MSAAVETAHPSSGVMAEAVAAPPARLLRWPVGRYLFVGDIVTCVLLALPLLPWSPSIAVVPLIIAISHLTSGLYRSRLTLSVLDDLPSIGRAVLTAVLVSIAVDAARSEPDYGRALAYGISLLAGLCIARATAYATVRFARRNHYVRHRAVVIGAGRVGIHIARILKHHPEYGLEPVGFIDDRPRVEDGSELPAPVLGDYESLSRILQNAHARLVIVAFGAMPESKLVEILRTSDRLSCEMFFVPRLFEVQATTSDMDQVWGIPLVRVRRAPFRKLSWRFKRAMDVVLSLVLLTALAPVIAACAIAVRLETRGPILFKQERVGLDGRRFTLLKFRSLTPSDAEESASRWNCADDERIGPVGRFIRSTSMDELPQLWNVLRGDMSLVGPRPERPLFVEEFRGRVPRYLSRHRVPSGISGHAQVHGLRGDTSIQDRALFDNYYIENWSLWGDVKILLRTAGQVVRRAGR